jgi:hypothetical protein
MHFYPADILLPDFGPGATDGTRWATVACDQYTSEPAYWKRVADFVGDAPSTLRLMLPEIYLADSAELVPRIRGAMYSYLDGGILREHLGCGIFLERTLGDGRVRRGVVGCIDLEEYDFTPGSNSPVRSTEKTVTERIPPRLAVRRGAPVELPHVLLLTDDPEDTVIGPLRGREADAYSFPLMEGGGSVAGSFIGGDDFVRMNAALDRLAEGRDDPIVFAVGDGNHSLATAKAAYEELKAARGEEFASGHPSRFALVEVVNVHDPSIEFEPIYRLCATPDPAALLSAFAACLSDLRGGAAPQKFTVITAAGRTELTAPAPELTLPVATLQAFLDGYSAGHPEVSTDYIHGARTLERLASEDGFCGFLFEGMSKSELFPAVERDGNLPRKTFSMGRAEDKRFYIEARKIV